MIFVFAVGDVIGEFVKKDKYTECRTDNGNNKVDIVCRLNKDGSFECFAETLSVFRHSPDDAEEKES